MLKLAEEALAAAPECIYAKQTASR